MSRDSGELFDGDGDSEWRRATRERDIALDEIAEVIGKHYPGQSAEAKKTKADLLEEFASTRSWERVKALRPAQVIDLRNRLWLRLEGVPYAFVPPPYTSTTGQAPANSMPGQVLPRAVPVMVEAAYG